MAYDSKTARAHRGRRGPSPPVFLRPQQTAKPQPQGSAPRAGSSRIRPNFGPAGRWREGRQSLRFFALPRAVRRDFQAFIGLKTCHQAKAGGRRVSVCLAPEDDRRRRPRFGLELQDRAQNSNRPGSAKQDRRGDRTIGGGRGMKLLTFVILPDTITQSKGQEFDSASAECTAQIPFRSKDIPWSFHPSRKRDKKLLGNGEARAHPD